MYVAVNPVLNTFHAVSIADDGAVPPVNACENVLPDDTTELGVGVGVKVLVGVKVGVTDGVTDNVTDGVTDGVIVLVGVIVGVGVGVAKGHETYETPITFILI